MNLERRHPPVFNFNKLARCFRLPIEWLPVGGNAAAATTSSSTFVGESHRTPVQHYALLRFGFYDESLLLSRSLGEAANLLQLFFQEAGTLQDWKVLCKEKRMKNFSPAKVRIRLEELQTSPAIDRERYGLLCERAAHVQPETRPQAHNILGLPMVGASFQEEGVLVCLNEIALPLATAVFFGAAVLDLDEEIKSEIFSATESLVEKVGGAMITTIDDYHRSVLEDPRARNVIKKATKSSPTIAVR